MLFLLLVPVLPNAVYVLLFPEDIPLLSSTFSLFAISISTILIRV
jgi:hypothetical protein